MGTTRESSTASRIAVGAIAAVAVVGSMLMPIAAHGATEGGAAQTALVAAGPGESEASAAASCWEIKQKTPAAPSGAYWLVTPALKAPQQFYCDQVTDGGGWVLIGRGRENWNQSNAGRLSARDVWETPAGVQAFNPAQLDVDTISGLLNDGRVDQLADGVRLRRATNTAGTTWQEARFTYASNRDDWSWQFMGLQRVGTWKFDTTSGSGGTTDSWGNNSTFRRVDTAITSGKGVGAWIHVRLLGTWQPGGRLLSVGQLDDGRIPTALHTGVPASEAHEREHLHRDPRCRPSRVDGSRHGAELPGREPLGSLGSGCRRRR